MTPRERRDWPYIAGALGFLLGFCVMGALRYFGV